jgi:hypothetical protein
MKHNPSTIATDHVTFVRLAGAGLAAFAAACLLCGIAATLPAHRAAAEQPVTAFYAVYQEITPSLEPPIDDLRNLVGKTAEVTFTVLTVGGKANLYLNSQKDWRSADCFTAMLVPTARDELKKLGFDDPFDDLIGRQVRCRGELELDRDRVRIVVNDLAKQFELVGPNTATDDSHSDGPQAASTGEGAPTTGSSDAETPAAGTSVASVPITPYVHPSIEELRTSVGKECDVTFRVMNAGGRTHLYINSQKDYRRPDCFTAQVDPSAVDSLTSLGLAEPRTEIIGKLIECRGTVQLDNDRVSILVTDVKNQLHIVDESSEQSAAAPKPATEPHEAP